MSSDCGDAGQGFGVGEEDAGALAAVAGPEFFVGVVAAAEIEFGDGVALDEVFNDQRGEDGAWREGAVGFCVGEFEDCGTAVVDDPELGGDGGGVQVEQTEFEHAGRCGFAHEGGVEERVGFRPFPA